MHSKNVILITGASSGFGYNTTLELIQRGYTAMPWHGGWKRWYRCAMPGRIFFPWMLPTMHRCAGGDRVLVKNPNSALFSTRTDFAREYRSDDDFVYHCKIVNAMHHDMFGEELYLSCYLKSVSDGTYMTAADEEVVLRDQVDETTLVRMKDAHERTVMSE